MQSLQGEGVFAPLVGETLPSTSYKIVYAENTVEVSGCLNVEYIKTQRPFGTLYFSYILMPDYVSDVEPVEVLAYSDDGFQNLVFRETVEDGGGVPILQSQL